MTKLTLYIFIMVTFISCKYEDGPKVSIRSKQHRLINSWTIDKIYLDGIDKTDYYKPWFVDYRIDIRRDKSYAINYDGAGKYPYHEKGSWSFSDDKMEMVLTHKMHFDDSLPRRWKIMRLKEKSFWIKGDISMERFHEELEVHFK